MGAGNGQPTGSSADSHRYSGMMGFGGQFGMPSAPQGAPSQMHPMQNPAAQVTPDSAGWVGAPATAPLQGMAGSTTPHLDPAGWAGAPATAPLQGMAGVRGPSSPLGSATPQPSNPLAQLQQIRPEDQRMQAMRLLQQFRGFH